MGIKVQSATLKNMRWKGECWLTEGCYCVWISEQTRGEGGEHHSCLTWCFTVAGLEGACLQCFQRPGFNGVDLTNIAINRSLLYQFQSKTSSKKPWPLEFKCIFPYSFLSVLGMGQDGWLEKGFLHSCLTFFVLFRNLCIWNHRLISFIQ